MHEASVCLPPELTDLIIDNIPELWNPRISQVHLHRLPIFSSLALVCHSFRSRANKHRFSQLPLHVSALSAAYNSRLCVLDRLICQGFWPHDLAIAQHIRGLHLFLDLESERDDSVLETWLKDGIAVKILQRVFFRKSENIATTANYAFSLIALATVGWKNLPISFTSAIEGVCRSSNLTSLRFIGLFGLPQSIVSNNKIKNLVWTNSAFDLASPDVIDHDALQSGPPGNAAAQTSLSKKVFTNLETLDVDDSFLSLIGGSETQRSGTMGTPFLKVIKVQMYMFNDAAVLAGIIGQATTINTLQLSLKASSDTVPAAAAVKVAISIFDACGGSPHLTTLSIHYCFPDFSSRMRRSAGGRVADLLTLATIHTQLRNLDIVVLFGSPLISSKSVADVLRGHGCIDLADLFEKREFAPQLRSVRILFVIGGLLSPFHRKSEDETVQEQRLFEKNAKRYLATYFTELAELRPQIDIDITSMVDERGLRHSTTDHIFIQ